MNTSREKVGYAAIVLISIASIIVMMMVGPIAQDTGYHQFADQRMILGIPNFWNVMSNLPFLIVGLMGLSSLLRSGRIQFIAELKPAYVLFFAGVALVNFGSGYYHLNPGNETLVWDRLPMTFAFMALFAVIIAEFASVKISRFTLWPLVVFGAFSVFYWHFTETAGRGDLRLYLLVQFLPMLLIPLSLLLFKPRFTLTSGYWALLLAYLLAKVFEYYDKGLFESLGFISGHSLKHIVAALGVFVLLWAYRNRERL
jgi:hypothetical protein